MRKLLFLVISATLSAFVLLPPFVVQGQKDNAKKPDKATGRIIKSYRDGEGARPDWVEGSRQRSMAFLRSRGEAAGVRDPESELKLLAAKQDDLGQSHVRFEQVYNGVPVFGRQIITHLDGANGTSVTGVLFNGVRDVDTTPKLSAAQAIAAAKASFKNKEGSAKEPKAKLVILPPRDNSSDAMLTYQVQIFVEYPNKAPERREYFVDAESGNIVWYFNSLPTGTGYSLYSGAQYIPTTGSWGNFRMQSPTHSNSYTWDYTYGTIFTDYDDVWGDSTEWNRQTAGVDAHFAMTRTWDYFQTRHARCGMNNGCAQTFSAVHYGTNMANAFYSGGGMYFGDGDAYSNPWVSVDVVAHEFTHGVTEYAAGLQYVDESGAANESFSDIFGTAVEFSTGINPDYSIAEDVTYPGIRSMSDPSIFGHPDHYSERVYIGTGYDNGGVHFNSSIQNKAFYLLAEGGTHPQSGINVTGIGREAAERIFYRALEVYLWSSSQFLDVRNACLYAAADIYGSGSAQYNSTQAAWCAVGVGTGGCGGQPQVNNATFVSQSVPTSMVAGRSYSVSVTMNNSGTTTWTPGVHRLGSQNPENNSTWGGRVDLPYSVAPGQNVTFYFTVIAPSAGTYNFQWRMLEEYVQWFGDYTPNVVITVTSGTTNCSIEAMQTCEENGGVWNSTYCRCRYVPTCANGAVVCP